MLYFLILGGAFLTAVLLVMGMHRVVFASRLSVMQRLEAHTTDVSQDGSLAGTGEIPRRKGLKRELLNLMGLVGRIIPQRANLQAIQQKLNQAAILMRAEELIGFSFMSAAVVFLFFFLLLNQLFLALPLGVLAYFVPGVLVSWKKKKRMQALTDQLPEALDIIASGLRAGFSFPQAMAVVSREMASPIKDEFYRVIWENRMGKTLEEALHNMGERTDSDDLDLFITALLIQKQVGGNLAEVLNNISHTIRERVRIQGEINTLTAQGKMSAIIIILLPIALAGILTIINTEYMMEFFQDIIGQVLLVASIISMIIGTVIIRKIIDIDI